MKWRERNLSAALRDRQATIEAQRQILEVKNKNCKLKNHEQATHATGK